MITLIIPTLDRSKGIATADAAVECSGVDDVQAVVVHDTERAGFTRTVNRGLKQANGGHVCLLNDDCVMSPGWLAAMLAEMQKREGVGARFAGPSAQCRTYPQNGGRPGDKRRARFVDHLAGFCLLIHPQAVKPLNEAFIHYGSDVDLQWSAKQDGARALWIPGVYCAHDLHEPIAEWWAKDNQTLAELWRYQNG